MNLKLLLLGIVLFIMCLPAHAGSLKGVTMPDSIQVDGNDLVLNGMALRKKIFFKVYVAGLYLPQKESSGKKVLENDTPRQTVLHFLRSVPAKKMSSAWIEGLKENTPKCSDLLKKQFDSLGTMMEKVTDDDLMVFTYIPGKGTEIKVKGKVKGTFPGKAFADALFACWIGPEPGPGEDFKERLLGKK
ncbi:MAG: hypothetical protein GY765_03895 [bacterium]|nr:hypothetical protein [bacterium]